MAGKTVRCPECGSDFRLIGQAESTKVYEGNWEVRVPARCARSHELKVYLGHSGFGYVTQVAVFDPSRIGARKFGDAKNMTEAELAEALDQEDKRRKNAFGE